MAQLGVDREGFRPSYRPAKAAAGGIDPDMKRLGLIAAVIGGGIALLVGAGSLTGTRHHGVPVIEAEAGPVRIKPVNAGGEQFTGADLGLGVGTTQTLAPSAEQPQINALKAQIHAMSKELARQAAATAQATKLAEATSSKIVAAPPVERASATTRVAVPESATVVAFNPPVKAAAVTPRPAAKPVAAPVAAPRAAAAAAGVAPGVAAGAAGASVQLAAFTDEAAARTGWDALIRKAPGLLGGRTPEISKVQASGRTMWRLRTGGFATVSEAAGFCSRMRATGADCAIAAF
jgi:hypothetical protein